MTTATQHVRVIRSADRHRRDLGWLSTHWPFSFSDYHDPASESFGPLRVFNDDVVQPGQGFGQHPHRDMEIISYVVSGQLEHRDHLGNHGIVGRGGAQAMSAGKGIVHSEFNPSPGEPVHFLQLWIIPRTRGLTPRWLQRDFRIADRTNVWLPIASGSRGEALPIDQDGTVYVSRLEAGRALTHGAAAGRRTYLFVISGGVEAHGERLAAGDQVRTEGVEAFDVVGKEDAELMLIDLA